jgi:hypothetical protein
MFVKPPICMAAKAAGLRNDRHLGITRFTVTPVSRIRVARCNTASAHTADRKGVQLSGAHSSRRLRLADEVMPLPFRGASGARTNVPGALRVASPRQRQTTN